MNWERAVDIVTTLHAERQTIRDSAPAKAMNSPFHKKSRFFNFFNWL
jgi:hypothetical protein